MSKIAGLGFVFVCACLAVYVVASEWRAQDEEDRAYWI